MISLDSSPSEGAKIRVIGVGGGGGNAINSMITLGLEGVDFIAANTDKQALDHNLAQTTIQAGKDRTNGLGAGADPEIGRESVEENIEEIKEVLKGSDMIFVTAGMGGGTGTGGSPMIAEIGQELDALVVAIVTKPFMWEGRKRMLLADQGIKDLRQKVDALIVIPNQKLLDIIDKNTTFGEAFRKVDEVLYNATRGIADIISRHGIVNVDFADVKTVMKGMGDALMGIGTATGEHRAMEATQDALNSPLLEGISISGAQGVLVNITGGSDMTMHEVTESVSIVEKAAGDNVNLIHGVVYNDEPQDEIMVTVVATGFRKEEEEAEETQKAELEEQKLPFPPHNNNNRKIYTRPPVRFPGSGRISSEKSEKSGTGIDNENVASPRGFNQLKKYDSPAYERRGNSDGSNSDEKNKDGQTPDIDKKQKENLDRPAFLRKIMD